MNYLDLIILSVIGLFALRGLWRGLFQELFGLISLVAAFIVATKYMSNLAFLIKKMVSIPPAVASVVGFLVVFFAIILGFQFLAHLLQKLMQLSFLGWLEKLAGGAFGGLKGATIMSLLILFVSMVPFADQMIPDRGNSLLYERTKTFAPKLFNFVIKVIPNSKTFYSELKESLTPFSISDLGKSTQDFFNSIQDHNQASENKTNDEQPK